jgi:uncharacterized protein
VQDYIDENVEPSRYRILSLDGGGIKGTYTAAVLATLESITGKSIGRHFDLIAGTSTGGIIAIAIGLGIPLSEILKLYVTKGPGIFPCSTRGWRGKLAECWRHLKQPKHSQAVLQESLEAIIGERFFGESNNRLVIPAYNAVSGNIQLFKTAHCRTYGMDYMLPATTVALATSAAPTYFDAYTDSQGRAFVDGGVWANCPAMVAIVEATSALAWPIDKIDVLSIGTTSAPFEICHKRRKGGLARWNKGLVDLLMEAQVQGTLGLAEKITNKRLLRIDAIARPGRFTLDNSNEISELKALGENSARQFADAAAQRFFHDPIQPFTPHFVGVPQEVLTLDLG